jgi:cell division protein FtsW
MAKRVGVDKWLFFTTLLLVVVGLVMVFSASAVVAQERYHSEFADVGRQAGWALAGVLAMVVLMNIDVSRYKSPRFIYPAICVTTILLVMVFFVPGSHNTHRWIRFGSRFTFQPSEIAKPVLVLFLAWFLHNRLDAMHKFKETLLPAAFIPLLFILLVVRQPDLGTAMVLAGVTGMMLVLAGLEWKYVAGGATAMVLGVAPLLYFVAWRWKRVLAFLNPDADLQGAGFYLPAASTDFIFANIAEELGFIGAITILLLFVVFGIRGMRAALRSRDPFSRMVAFGISGAILLQAFFNISVVLSMVPTKGIPLPLISSGGTSLFCTLASIGILLNITRKVE